MYIYIYICIYKYVYIHIIDLMSALVHSFCRERKKEQRESEIKETQHRRREERE